MVPQPKKIGRVLKSAASSATRLKPIRGVSRRAALTPQPGETPAVLLRVQIISGKDLLAKDRNGVSDPFVVVSFSRQRNQTPALKRTINPAWEPKDATFDFPIYLSLVGALGVLELVLWDKDTFKKEYLGEVALSLEDWFKDGTSVSFDDPRNEPFWTTVVSTKPSTPSAGFIQIKLGFVPPKDGCQTTAYDNLYAEFLRISGRAGPTLLTAAPTIGIGTIRSGREGPAFEDDGLSSDGDGDSEAEDPEPGEPGLLEPLSSSPLPMAPAALEPPPSPAALAGSESPGPERVKPHRPLSASFIPKFHRRQSSTPISLDSGATSETTPILSPDAAVKGKRLKFRRPLSARNTEYNLSAGNDILGIVMLEVQSAKDLPKLKNLTRLGWDMDPFVVVSFGKKVFRTRVIRHSLNPTWDEKLLFHVRRYESNFKVHFTILDWDKLSGNDHVGDATIDLTDLLDRAPKKDPVTGIYPNVEAFDHDMMEFQLPLTPAKDVPWEAKHKPTITFIAKYQPYDALRQRFWRQYLTQYDLDDNGTISHLEISSMLDSLGSTLSRETVDSFLTRHGKPIDGELSFDEVVMCLEQELMRPRSEKKRISDDNAPHFDSSASVTPGFLPKDFSQPPVLDRLNFAGPLLQQVPHLGGAESSGSDSIQAPVHFSEPPQQPLSELVPPSFTTSSSSSTTGLGLGMTGGSLATSDTHQSSVSSSDAEDSSGNSDDVVERVINIKNCPLCHRPRLKSRAEADIVTHIALCASRDWGRVDRIVVGNFVTASQAQRKWYTKVITKVSSGAYQLGANSANIIVQNRMTGQLEEEKMQVYVRLGIRLLYKGATSRMEGHRARRLLKSMSIKQGMKYDSPESAREIPAFIEFHKLNVDEIRDPIDSFKTFNQFFYRKLKESARPVDSPDDPTVLVSGADCRMMAFETVHEATQLWIKGREFTVSRLLGDRYKDQGQKYVGGALAIFRLAPQDYHRFHSPVDGIIGPMTYVSGEYYTVNPQAIRTSLDVYGENARKIVPIDSPVFGRVFAVCIGAMMVGSILTTVEEGDHVTRGQEFGYFAFGGSTIVLLFEKGFVQWDEDLLVNGRASLETLVRVGMRIGKRTRSAGKGDT
ncbi:phosphatidylserine decarboxylase-domain-containing protein [Gautieria morchelliformis]|nr:phosphatidylserine decarboxylase-domain-containing protein [Gautieria morchelliformis]